MIVKYEEICNDQSPPKLKKDFLVRDWDCATGCSGCFYLNNPKIPLLYYLCGGGWL